MSIDALKDLLPDYARDLKLNLSSLAAEPLLSPQQKAGSFIAAALAADHAPTTQAVVGTFAAAENPAPTMATAFSNSIGSISPALATTLPRE